MRLKSHPIAGPFPILTGAELRELAADIAANGLREPIVLFQGAILDGRTRYRAANDARYNLSADDFVDFPGTWEEAMAYCISRNLRRRHLSESLRADIAAALSRIPRPVEEPAQISAARPAMSQRQAAEAMNVSRRSVQAAVRYQEHGIPELAEAVRAGAMSVAAAEKLSTLPAEEQRSVVSAGPAEVKKTVRQIRTSKPKPAPPSFVDRFGVVATELRSLLDEAVTADADTVDRGALRDVAAALRNAADRLDALATGVTDDDLHRLIADA
jgi:hypothetical protein